MSWSREERERRRYPPSFSLSAILLIRGHFDDMDRIHRAFRLDMKGRPDFMDIVYIYPTLFVSF